MTLYWSEDNGQLYQAKDVDLDTNGKAVGFVAYEVNEPVVFSPEQLCVQDGSIMEALLRTKQAKQVK